MKKVITYGTYDLLHQGHINLLRRAKELGDYLIVGVTSDSFDRERGKLNVRNNVLERIEAVRQTGYADEIVIEDYVGQKIDDIQRFGVDIFAIGSDWQGHFDYLKEFCQVVYLPRTEGISSTQLREEVLEKIKIGIIGTGRIAQRFIPEGLAQLQPGNAVQLVVGYMAAQGDHYLAVYSYENGELATILEQQYEQYLVEDITGGGNQDLILMSTLEDGGVQIELLTVDKEGSFQQVAVMGLSANRFAGCASVAAGMGADRKHYLVLDGWTGISGNNLASVLLHFDEDTQQMVPASQISTERLYTASLRNVPGLVSRDLDGDGIVEIPTQPEEAGLLNMSQGRRMDFIVWMDYTSSHPEKSFGLLDEETNCYIELPMEWEGNLKLTDSEQYDGAVELRTVDEDQPVMTLRLARTTASSKGWTRLGMVASRQWQAKLGEDVEITDQDYRLSRALHLIN